MSCLRTLQGHCYGVRTGRMIQCVPLILLVSSALYWLNSSIYRNGEFLSEQRNSTTLNDVVRPHRVVDVVREARYKLSYEVTLMVRTGSALHLIKFIFCTLLRSVSLFWGKGLGNMAVILDKESPFNERFVNALKSREDQIGLNFEFYYEPLPKNPEVLKGFKKANAGYNRQLYSTFLMDAYIKTPVVAYVDTDAKFITPITKENIFNGNRLRVTGMDSSIFHDWFDNWAATTKLFLGKPMISDFMTFFPVYLWRDTITNCRNYILKHMNATDMEQAYILGTRSVGFPSPVSILLSYAFYYERERYDWHIDIFSANLEEYNKLHVASGFALNSSHLTPDLHTMIHEKYYTDPKGLLNKRSFCAAVQNTSLYTDNYKQMCQPFEGTVMWPLYEFERNRNHLNSWCKGNNPVCITLINNHYNRVQKLIRDGVYTPDINKVKAVEMAATSCNVTCKPFFGDIR